MSQIDDLIKQHCPHGVEFAKIGDIFETRNGYTPSKSEASNWTNGTIPWFRMEDIRAYGRILDSAIQRIPQTAVKGGRLFPANSIIVATSATIGEHALITVPFMANQRFTAIWLKPSFVSRLDIKFVFYYCFILDEWCRNNITTSSFASVDMTGFKRFKFPIPPLEVQREIVKVLDTFSKLEAELEAELEARRRQYKVYCDQLLTFDERDRRVRWAKMREIFSMRSGQHLTASEIAESRSEEARYPVYGGNGLRGFGKSRSHNGRYLLIGRQGALCGNVKRTAGEFYATEHAIVTEPNTEMDVDFAFYLLTLMDLNKYKSAGAQPGLAVGKLGTVLVPVPPIEEQRKIAGLLDKFDALVNDLSIGLPAELKARCQQQEYYRDRLLTFQEAV